MPKRPSNSAYSPGRGSATIGDYLCTPIDTEKGLDLQNAPESGEKYAHSQDGAEGKLPK